MTTKKLNLTSHAQAEQKSRGKMAEKSASIGTVDIALMIKNAVEFMHACCAEK